MLLPVTQRLLVDGHARAEADVAMTAAGSIVLSVVDAAGRPCGPDLAVQLASSDGRPVAARWRAVGDGSAAPAAGTLPAAAACELDEPMPPGDYQLQVSGPGIDERRALHVVPGQRTRVELAARR
jgi:hypothetical protein